MRDPKRGPARPEVGRSLVAGVVSIVLTGVVLGVVYNYLGLRSPSGWGMTWLARDKMTELVALPAVSGDEGDYAESSYATQSDDPLAVPGGIPGSGELPPIPDIGRPVPIALSAVKQYVDAGAALIVDAREPEEFSEGRIPGAINLTYDEVVTDPARLESLDTGGRPIITYCGGGTCEQSVSLGEALYFAGHKTIAVYLGGLPEWVGAGYPLERGGEAVREER